MPVCYTNECIDAASSGDSSGTRIVQRAHMPVTIVSRLHNHAATSTQ
jgi:hypothetical protein